MQGRNEVFHSTHIHLVGCVRSDFATLSRVRQLRNDGRQMHHHLLVHHRCGNVSRLANIAPTHAHICGQSLGEPSVGTVGQVKASDAVTPPLQGSQSTAADIAHGTCDENIHGLSFGLRAAQNKQKSVYCLVFIAQFLGLTRDNVKLVYLSNQILLAMPANGLPHFSFSVRCIAPR